MPVSPVNQPYCPQSSSDPPVLQPYFQHPRSPSSPAPQTAHVPVTFSTLPDPAIINLANLLEGECDRKTLGAVMMLDRRCRAATKTIYWKKLVVTEDGGWDKIMRFGDGIESVASMVR